MEEYMYRHYCFMELATQSGMELDLHLLEHEINFTCVLSLCFVQC